MDKLFKRQLALWSVGLAMIFSFISNNKFNVIAQDAAEVAIIKQVVRKQVGQADLPLHVILLPKVTEDMITIEREQRKTIEPLSLQLRFYEVIPAIYGVREGKIVSE